MHNSVGLLRNISRLRLKNVSKLTAKVENIRILLMSDIFSEFCVWKISYQSMNAIDLKNPLIVLTLYSLLFFTLELEKKKIFCVISRYRFLRFVFFVSWKKWKLILNFVTDLRNVFIGCIDAYFCPFANHDWFDRWWYRPVPAVTANYSCGESNRVVGEKRRESVVGGRREKKTNLNLEGSDEES